MKRDYYLEQLILKKDNKMIKVITGIRRCGKSYLLFNIYKPWLLNNGVKEENIISIKLDEEDFKELLDPQKLYSFVNSKIDSNTNNYVLIDEIGTLDGYEKILNSLNNKDNVDVYVTGSNSKLLSNEISTYLRGRDDQIKVYPLTFKEIYKEGEDKIKSFENFIFYGGMPQIQDMKSDVLKQEYLKRLFNLVYIKDITERYKVERTDILESIIDTISSSIGSYTSIRNITNTINSGGNKISKETVAKYVSCLVNSFMFEKAIRYDIKGKQYLEGIYKYYSQDHGLRNARLNYRQMEKNHIIENIVFIELLSRGYLVDIGTVYSETKKILEVDFIARKGPKQYYIQVAYSLPTSDKIEQEINPFKRIKDNFRKIVVTYEYSLFTIFEDGYERINIIDFLLNTNYLD